MDQIILSNDINYPIKFIYHLADIHIRLDNKRHEEYTLVFEKLYNKIREKTNSITIICGDILHSKLELSPECLKLTIDFFKNIANITPLLIIAGNHDFAQNNSTRLDSLSPIIQEIKAVHTIYYLKNSGEYIYNNLVFGVSSLIDNLFIKASDIQTKNKTKIALYHGPVAGSVDFVGYKMKNYDYLVSDFKGYDYVLLGDIHKHQYLGINKRIAYPSSLIQQNYGETVNNHGYLLWDLTLKTSTFIEIPNDYGFITLNINNGVIATNHHKIPPKPKIRFILQNTSQIQFEKIKKNMLNKYDVQEIICEEVLKETKGNVKTNDNKINISDKNYQKTVITEFCEQKLKIFQPPEIKKILDFHEKISNKIPETTKVSSTWTINSLKFSNMFCYTANNHINFNSMNGIVGIVAKNGAGKSSIFDVILYALFNKCSKGDRISVLNNTATEYSCSLFLTINNNEYLIERLGTTTLKKDLKETVNFYKVEKNKQILLNGKDRIETNANITNLIGTYNDCIITTFCLQDEVNFINYTQNKKKEFLSKILGLSLFDKLFVEAKTKLNCLNSKYKVAMKEINLLNIDKLKENLELHLTEFTKMQEEKKSLELDSKGLNEKIKDLQSRVCYLEKDVVFEDKNVDKQLLKLSKDLEMLNSNQQKIKEQILSQQQINELQVNEQELCELQDQRSKLISQIKPLHKILINNDLESSLITVTTSINANQIALDTNRIKYNNLQLLIQKENKTKLFNLNIKFENNKEKSIKSLKTQIEQLYSQIKPLNKYSKNSKQQHTKVQNTIKAFDFEIKELEDKNNLLKDQIIAVQNYDETKINYDKHLEAEKVHTLLQQKLKNKTKEELSIKSHIITSSHLKQEYDPNCKYCVINSGLSELESEKERLSQVQNKIVGINNNILAVTQTLYELSIFKESYFQNNAQIEKNNKLAQQIERNQHRIDLLLKDKTASEKQLLVLNTDLQNEKENVAIIKKNAATQNSIKIINSEIETISKSQCEKYHNFKELEKELEVMEAIINKLELNLVKDINKQQAIQLEINKVKENELVTSSNKIINENVKELENRIALLCEQKKEFDRQILLVSESKDLHIQILNLLTSQTNLLAIQKNNKIYKDNIAINKEIKENENKFEKIKSAIDKLALAIVKNESEQYAINSEINKYNKLQLATLEMLEKKTIVEKYISIVDKNGLPHTLLSKTTPKIKQEMNKILNTIANFTIDLCLDNDKVEIYKLTGNQKKQSIEGCCGFEKFIIGLAARLTLSKISNVNNNSTLVIDEGLSCLDNENINSLDVLYNYLRNNFKYVILISHIQHIRGSCDKLVNIVVDPVTKKSYVEF